MFVYFLFICIYKNGIVLRTDAIDQISLETKNKIDELVLKKIPIYIWINPNRYIYFILGTYEEKVNKHLYSSPNLVYYSI